jgi:putative transposase
VTAYSTWSRPSAQCGHHRQSKCQDDGKRGPRGYDGGKRVNGRKRHILVDTNGFLLKVLIHSADVLDSQGGISLLTPVIGQFPRLAHVWADGGYKKPCIEWVKQHLAWSVQIVKRGRKREGVMDELARLLLTPTEYDPVYGDGFRVLPWRWIVERTFALFNPWPRLNKDYELLPLTSQTHLYVVMSRLMLRRLARPSS